MDTLRTHTTHCLALNSLLRAHDKLTSPFWNFIGLENGRTRSNYEEVILTQALTSHFQLLEKAQFATA